MTDERTKEALRYLGYGRQQADSLVAEKIGQAFRELERTVDRRFVSREFDLSLTGDGEVWIGGMHIRSRSLGKNMKGCCRAICWPPRWARA